MKCSQSVRNEIGLDQSFNYRATFTGTNLRNQTANSQHGDNATMQYSDQTRNHWFASAIAG
jgi:hypothetical protein